MTNMHLKITILYLNTITGIKMTSKNEALVSGPGDGWRGNHIGDGVKGGTSSPAGGGRTRPLDLEDVHEVIVRHQIYIFNQYVISRNFRR